MPLRRRRARAYDRHDDHPGANPPEPHPATQPPPIGAVASPVALKYYVPGELRLCQVNRDGAFPLFRLQYAASASLWGFALYLVQRELRRAVLPTGLLAGKPEDALDCVCVLYVEDEGPYDRDRRYVGAPLFSRTQLARLFEPATLDRGLSLADTIEDLYEDEWSIVGTVTDGSRSFLAMVHHGNVPLSTECDCPDGRGGSCCCHAAVGLCYLDGR